MTNRLIFLKALIVFATGIVLLSSSASFAAPVIASDVVHTIKSMQEKYGVGYVRMVMPGVLYRGGTNPVAKGSEYRNPLNGSTLQALCNDGFDAAVYGYPNNWKGGAGISARCENGQLTYVMKKWDRPSDVADVMKELYNIINEGKGAMYVHCWYGVHASGMIASAALKQFCGLSDEQAVSYWKSTVSASSLWYPKVIAAIRSFKPNPSLGLSPEQQRRVCPQL